MNIIFKVLSTKILTFYLLHVISISVKVIVEKAKAIYGHLWAHKSYVLILEMCLLYIYTILGCFYHPSLYNVSTVKKKKRGIVPDLVSPVVMAAARWFIIEGTMEMCSL